jgi:Ca-activated chloride channel family protein
MSAQSLSAHRPSAASHEPHGQTRERRRRFLAAIAVAAVVALPTVINGQAPVFRSGTRVVSLFATVFDGKGRLVPDLVEGDFEIYDNEKPQPIVLFDNKIQPITVVVMLDTSLSMTGSMKRLQEAAEQFVLRLLPDDKAKIGAFNDKIEISSEFTSERDQLVSAVKDVDFGNATRLWDALGASLDELKGLDGRRVVLVFTDGDDQGSRIGLGTIVDRARAEEVMVYAIGLESDYFNGQMRVRTRPDSGLKKLAAETGGGYFELERDTELTSTFTTVAKELHSQYLLAFEPPKLDGRVHKLVVKLKQPGYTARARRSYLAEREGTPSSTRQ